MHVFTCWHLTTLLGERLAHLLAAHPAGLVALAAPLTHVFDHAVTFKEARLLFARVIQGVTALHDGGPQTSPRHHLAQ